MIDLNLPIYNVKIKKDTQGKLFIFDNQRNKYVRLTPEEWVRQHFVNFLINNCQYPKGLISNEVSLTVGEKSYRADTVVYDKGMNAKILIEYKAPHVELTQKVIDQILMYDIKFQVEYIIISNGIRHMAWQIMAKGTNYQSLEEIPSADVLYNI